MLILIKLYSFFDLLAVFLTIYFEVKKIRTTFVSNK